MINFEGKVTSGLGKAGNFMQKDTYKKQYKNKLGFEPYPGTLNIIVEEDNLDNIKEMKNSCPNIIKPDQDFGAVKYITAKLENIITGAIVFPAKTTHEEHYLEFIARDNLREKLNLSDGDKVCLDIEI